MTVKLESPLERLSYALAMNLCAYIKQIPVPVDEKLISGVLPDLLSGTPPQLGQEEYQEIMKDFQGKLRAAAQAESARRSSANLAAGKEFLQKNAKKEGVVTTASGLQYQVLREGQGDSPKADDVVRVHYEGSLLDGTVFDSSIRRGEPAEFPLNQVISGWTEALQLMKKGGKARLFIPPELAYGTRGAGGMIGPDSTLIFDVELLDILGKA